MFVIFIDNIFSFLLIMIYFCREGIVVYGRNIINRIDQVIFL